MPNSGVHTVTSLHWIFFRNEWTFRLITYSNTYTKYIILIFQREIHIVLTVSVSNIAIPKLTSCPGYVFCLQNHTMISNFSVFHIFHRKNVIVLHIEMVAVIILRDTTFPVM